MSHIPVSNTPTSAASASAVTSYFHAVIRWIKQDQTQFGLQVFVRATAALLAG